MCIVWMKYFLELFLDGRHRVHVLSTAEAKAIATLFFTWSKKLDIKDSYNVKCVCVCVCVD